MIFVIDFYEVQGTEKVYRFTGEFDFRDVACCKFWVYEYLETSNVWKNHKMIAEISLKRKIIIHYNGEQ